MVRGKSIYHCKGKDKGKVYRTYKSKKQALSVHRAIMANRNDLRTAKRKARKNV